MPIVSTTQTETEKQTIAQVQTSEQNVIKYIKQLQEEAADRKKNAKRIACVTALSSLAGIGLFFWTNPQLGLLTCIVSLTITSVTNLLDG